MIGNSCANQCCGSSFFFLFKTIDKTMRGGGVEWFLDIWVLFPFIRIINEGKDKG